MFFGLEVHSSQGKTLDLDKNLKISQAVLKPTKNGKRGLVSLWVEYEKQKFILAVIDPNLTWQSSLDILFEAGSKVKFSIKGTGTIHITGFYDTGSDLDTDLVSMSSDEDYSLTDSDYEPTGKANGFGTPDKKTTGKKRSAEELEEEDDESMHGTDNSTDDDDDDEDGDDDDDEKEDVDNDDEDDSADDDDEEMSEDESDLE